MKRVLFDECLPRRLGALLVGSNVTTVPQAGLAGFKNGRLLAAIARRFDVFVTIDGNLEYQQNLIGVAIGIVVVHAESNRLETLLPNVPSIIDAISRVRSGEILSAT